jgi:hypothetical protein
MFGPAMKRSPPVAGVPYDNPGICATLGNEEGRVELGEVRYDAAGRQWERFDGQGWTAIVAQPVAAQTGMIVYESTDNGE